MTHTNCVDVFIALCQSAVLMGGGYSTGFAFYEFRVPKSAVTIDFEIIKKPVAITATACGVLYRSKNRNHWFESLVRRSLRLSPFCACVCVCVCVCVYKKPCDGPILRPGSPTKYVSKIQCFKKVVLIWNMPGGLMCKC
jgi:hypothetical protein